MDKLRLIFVILTIGYSLVWFAAYRFMKVDRPVPMGHHPTPIETTTAEERARGESSFEIARGRQFGVTRAGFVGLVIIGYVALAVAFAIALIVLRSSTT
jgi:hypothetical protein